MTSFEDEKTGHKISAEGFIKLALAIYFCSIAITIVPIAYGIHRSIQSGIKNSLQMALTSFTENVTHDLLTGADFDVFRKCSRLFRENGISAVLISTSEDRVVCNLSRSDSESHFEMSSDVFFDTEKREKAGIIRVRYSDNPLRRAQLLTASASAVFLITSSILPFSFLWFLRRRV